MKTKKLLLVVAPLLLMGATPTPTDAPQFTKEGRLVRPDKYREWIFLSSGLGMTYGPLARPGEPSFDNVFVNPSAYREFLETGRWPNGTVFVLEVRSSQSQGSINRGGHYQGDVVGIETHVKDEKRFARKWAFFGFNGDETVSEEPAADKSACYACHEPNGAVDTTFVQFYPTLVHVAKQKGTYK
jgi:hypothetical protein